jgi:prepilin-type processing-associated H-X9-DG protein
LVVIAIIAILAAILFPVFARARENARKSNCLSNFKQIGNAWTMYAQDYDERYVLNIWQASTWNPPPPQSLTAANLLLPYTKNAGIYKCPSCSWPSSPNQSGINNLPTNSVGFNNFACGQAAGLTTLDNVADIICAADASSIWLDTCCNHIRMCARHLGMITVAFLDGHAKAVKLRSIRPQQFRMDLTGFYGTKTGVTAPNVNGTDTCGSYPQQWDAVPETLCLPLN